MIMKMHYGAVLATMPPEQFLDALSTSLSSSGETSEWPTAQ